MNAVPKELLARFERAGQGHVLRFWDRLPPERREAFAAELAQVDLASVARLRALLEAPPAASASVRFEPPAVFPLERGPAEARRAAEAIALGGELLSAGKVGFMVVAGGQGSRLGFEAPKGAFPIGPLTRAPLFALLAARLQAAGSRHGFRPAWYVMTSPANDEATRAFFAEHDHFGLPAGDVFFFSQAMLPALTEDGRIVLEEEGKLFLAPNGHGGSLAALATSGALADMEARGIEHVSYFQVDNPLARPADPLFIGLHAKERAGMSSKVVAKRDAAEKVGVIGLCDGKLGCIEYSDLPPDLREARDPKGELLFRAGNIAAHVLSREFVRELNAGGTLNLPWHLARKKLRSVDDDGRPAEVQGVKFETFVFDALSHTPRSVTLEIDRKQEFSPVKNATGQDSPESCRADLVQHFAELAEQAGLAAPPRDSSGLPRIEIDPRAGETADELRARAPRPATLAGGHHYA